MGCLGGVEVDVMQAHEDGLMMTYSEEYHKFGGPLIDPNYLSLMFRLSFISTFVGNLQYIDKEVLVDMPSKAEWNSVTDRWDPRVMGKWNVRCRTIGIMLLLKTYQALPMYSTFMDWVKANPELCKEPAT
eukprot:4448829-Prymnesium_polylepis.2